MRQNTVFSTKNTKKISGEGLSPPQALPPVGRGHLSPQPIHLGA